MLTQLIKSTFFFQQLLSSRFRTLKERVVKTIMLLSLCHLFGLYNPNQVADALCIPKARLYRELNTMSLLSLAASFCAYRVFYCVRGDPGGCPKKCCFSVASTYRHQCG